MALRGFKAFTPEEVVFVKENLIRGVTVSDLARHFGVSIETVSKIKRGVTYVEIAVEGEEKLRPQNPLGKVNRAQGTLAPMIRAKTVEELDKVGEMILQEMVASGKITVHPSEMFGDIPDTPMD